MINNSATRFVFKISRYALCFVLAIVVVCCSDDDGPAKKFTFNVPDNFNFPEGTDYWIILSDAKGKVLDSHKLEKSDTYLFTSSNGYSENSVTMTILQYSVRGSGPFGYCQLFTYSNVPFGDHGYVIGPSIELPPIKGTSRWEIQDASLDNYHTIGLSSPVGSLSSLESNYADNSIYYNASIRTDETAFLLTRWDMGSLYYLEKRIVPGQDYVNTLADFKKAEVKAMSIPEADIVIMVLEGMNEYGQFGVYASNAVTGNSNTLNIPYPGDFFDTFRTYVTFSTKDGYCGMSVSGEIPSAMKVIDGSFDYKMNPTGITQTNTEGSCDMISYSGSVSRDLVTGMMWTVYAPPGDREIKLPELPENLIDLCNLSTKSFYEVVSSGYAENVRAIMTDFNNYEGYEDYISNSPWSSGDPFVANRVVCSTAISGFRQ